MIVVTYNREEDLKNLLSPSLLILDERVSEVWPAQTAWTLLIPSFMSVIQPVSVNNGIISMSSSSVQHEENI